MIESCWALNPWARLGITEVHETLLRSAGGLKNARIGKSNFFWRTLVISYTIQYTGKTRPSHPPPKLQGGSNTAQDKPQSPWKESDEWQTVRTKRSWLRQPTDQRSNEPSSRQSPDMFRFPLHRPESDRFSDSDLRAKSFTDKGIYTKEPSIILRGAGRAKGKPQV